MTPHPLLLRSHIEAHVIALALVRPDVAQAASRRALYSEMRPDCLALLDAIVTYPETAWRDPYALAENDVQHALVTDALAFTVHDLTLHDLTCLLALARGRADDAADVQEVAA